MDDPVNAFMPYDPVDVPFASEGPLSGLTLAVKDIFDVAGYKTGCGSPAKLEEAEICEASAPAVQAMVDAGAKIVGKTTTEELAFSLNGDNIHYPRPLNVRAEGRLTGGSSSGSAAAIAAGLVDIATGSDTGGSVRAPASYCGLIGLRTTHGRISLEGTMPLASTFDTFGWFTQNAETYAKVAAVLLGEDVVSFEPKRVMIAEDLLPLLMGIDEARAIDPAIEHVSSLALTSDASIANGALEDWYWAFRKVQAYEAWQAHGPWITEKKPNLGPGVKDRFAFGAEVTVEEHKAGVELRASLTKRVEDMLGDDGLFVFPTVPSIAPEVGLPFEALDDFRNRALRLLCVSGLTGLPQLTLPMVTYKDCPMGLSIMGPRGSDRALLSVGLSLLETFQEGH